MPFFFLTFKLIMSGFLLWAPSGWRFRTSRDMRKKDNSLARGRKGFGKKKHTLNVRCVPWPGHCQGRNAAVFVGGFSEVESHWVLGTGAERLMSFNLLTFHVTLPWWVTSKTTVSASIYCIARMPIISCSFKRTASAFFFPFWKLEVFSRSKINFLDCL